MSATIHNIPVRPTGELFKVPDGYFERFTSELMMIIKQTDAAMQREKGRFRAFSKFYERLRPFVSAAAVLLFAVLLSHFFYVAISDDSGISVSSTAVSDNLTDSEMADAYTYFITEYDAFYGIDE